MRLGEQENKVARVDLVREFVDDFDHIDRCVARQITEGSLENLELQPIAVRSTEVLTDLQPYLHVRAGRQQARAKKSGDPSRIWPRISEEPVQRGPAGRRIPHQHLDRRVLENDPTFNAGFGSVLNADGDVEMDAAIMDGATLDVGAVAALRGVRNPISTAVRLLRDQAVLLVGEGARRFAADQGMELCDPRAMIAEEIDQPLFDRSAARLAVRFRRLSDDELLQGLRDLWERAGSLSHSILENDPLTASPSAYNRRFGSFVKAAELIGYTHSHSFEYLDRLRSLDDWRLAMRAEIISGFCAAGASVGPLKGGRLLINGDINVQISVILQAKRRNKQISWNVWANPDNRASLVVICRMNAGEVKPFDYIVITGNLIPQSRSTLSRRPKAPFDRCVHQTLAPLFHLTSAEAVARESRRASGLPPAKSL